MVSLPANRKRRRCNVVLSAVPVLFQFSPSFPPVSGSPTSVNNCSRTEIHLIYSGETLQLCPGLLPTHQPVTISSTLEPSSADIERRGAADPGPPIQGGGREGGRWEPGWRAERVSAGLVGRTDRGSSLAAPLSTKTPRKQAAR